MINFCAIVILFLMIAFLLVFYTDLRERHDRLKDKVSRLEDEFYSEHGQSLADAIRNEHNTNN